MLYTVVAIAITTLVLILFDFCCKRGITVDVDQLKREFEEFKKQKALIADRKKKKQLDEKPRDVNLPKLEDLGQMEEDYSESREVICQLLKKHNDDTMKVLDDLVKNHPDAVRQMLLQENESITQVSALRQELASLQMTLAKLEKEEQALKKKKKKEQ
mmetsp:Transcript_9982/g.14975  ORF Transcript_9982/g.14975 Transcript_9982/m.14975 type:complete len:158 (+) Transcript_9982:61-534(+)